MRTFDYIRKNIIDIFAATIAIFVLFGWYTGNTSIITLIKNLPPMQISTAYCMLLSALGFIGKKNNYKFYQIFFALSLFISGTSLLQYVFSYDYGIDYYLTDMIIVNKSSTINRMSINTGLCFLILSLLGISKRFTDSQKITRILYFYLTLWVFFFSSLAISGYLLGAPSAYTWKSETGMAMHTSLGIALISLGRLICYIKNSRPTESINFFSIRWPYIIFTLILSFSYTFKVSLDRQYDFFAENSYIASSIILKGTIDRKLRETFNTIDDRLEKNELKKAIETLKNQDGIDIEVRENKNFKKSNLNAEGISIKFDNNQTPVIFYRKNLHSKEYMIELKSSELTDIDIKKTDHTGLLKDTTLKLVNDITTRKTQRTITVEFRGLQWNYEFKNIITELNVYSSRLNWIVFTGQLLIILLLMISYHFLTKVRNYITKSQNDQRYLTAILDGSPIPIIAMNNKRNIVEFNNAAQDFFGYNKEEVINKKIEILVPDVIKPEHPSLVKKFLANPTGRKIWSRDGLHGRHKSGINIPADVLLQPINIDNNFIVIASVIDLRDRKKSEEIILNKTREIEMAYEELEKTNEDLENFAYVVSHDLKAPIRHQMFYIDLLEESGVLSSDADKKSLNVIKKCTNQMNSMISSLLEVAKIKSTGINKEEINTNELLKETLEQFDNYKFDADVVELPNIFGDRVKLGLVFNNLIGNAIKYAKPNERCKISIRYSNLDGQHQFEVTDNGIGIEKGNLDVIFKIFQRLHKEEIEGSGIGLAITKKIIELHKGTITVESTPGVGSTFRFTIPS